MSCSLDGQDNVTVMGNTTLTGLSAGMHTLLVFAVDEVGNEGLETVTFSVSEPPQSLPLTEVAIASAVAAVTILAGALLIFEKRKRKLNSPQAN